MEPLNPHDLQKYEGLFIMPKCFTVQTHVSLDYRMSQDLVKDDVFDFDVYLVKYGINLQRPYVWEHYQANDFLISILLEKPISDIVVIKHIDDREPNNSKTKILVIDGKQRLLTIRKFLLGDMYLEVNGVHYYIKDLSEDLRLLFYRRISYLTATVYYSYFNMAITDNMKIALFNFYNFSGTPQTAEHKNMLHNLINSPNTTNLEQK